MNDTHRDFLGNEIKVGSKIVYAAIVGRSPRLTLGTVLEIGEPKTQYSSYKVSIKVQPHKDSWGRRWSNLEWDPLERKHVEVGDPKPVTLHFTSRLMVID